MLNLSKSLNKFSITRFPSDCNKEIASHEQEGKIKENRLGCL